MPAIPRKKPDLRARLHAIPHKPGVYLMRDRLNRVIYVGKARNLRKRVGQSFIPSRKMTADLKTRALLDSIWDFEVYTVNSEPEALLLEGRLIKEFRPRYNISFRDDKRFLLVKVDARDAWPRFRLTRFKGEEGARYFGPFAHAGALRQTLAFMRKKFGVLTFGRGNPTDRELKSSTYQVPMKLGEIGPEQYQERIERACEFLAGQSKEMLGQLEEEMKAAATALDFERAAELRNMLDDLRKTTRPMHRYTRAVGNRLGGNIDPEADMAALKDALQLSVLPRRMECFDISNISTTHVVASMVCFTEGRASNHLYRRFRIRTVEGQDDFASMAEVVRRRYARVLTEGRGIAARGLTQQSGEDTGQGMTKVEVAERHAEIDYAAEYSQENPLEALQSLRQRLDPRSTMRDPQSPLHLPDLVIIDGGKGQLNAACRELQRLGLHELPIIGLAKEFEEIYRPGRPQPIRLPEDSGALRLLQRIRDEAHRFANAYHQLLMKRRIAESILDDCPGVSQHRKELLLRHFGSVTRLRRATVEQIAEVAGIGRKLAEQITRFLAARPP